MIDIKTGVIVAALVGTAAISSLVTSRIQTTIYDAKEKQRVEQQLADERSQAAREQEAAATETRARDAATLRSANLRRDASRSRDALGRMRDANNKALRAAEGSLSACIVTATAQGDVLQQCGEKYRDLAETADRHVSDIQTMIDAAK